MKSTFSHNHANDHSHDHGHRHFDEIHADLASQFFGLRHRVRDTKEITELRIRLEAQLDDYKVLMELAEKLNFQLRYRESIVLYNRVLEIRPGDFDAIYARAARYYKTLQFENALSDYNLCNELSPDNREILYRLGITEYAMGRDAEAEKHLTRCYELFEDLPEMYVAAAYWLALSSVRGGFGSELWKTYDFSLETPHHHGYRDALRVLAGHDSAEAVFDKWSTHADVLNSGIVLYALSVYCRAHGNSVRADEIYSLMLTEDEYWAGFAYIAAWAERQSRYNTGD